jgi:asparagine synthase (glutamine-hydrolysing)
MAHGLEIRTPLADIDLLRALAPCLPQLRPGDGKAALAAAPSTPLPAEVVSRAKTGFSVPTGDWMTATGAGRDREPRLKGLASRQWARKIYAGAIPAPSLATAA